MELKIEKLIYGGDGLARLPADERGRGKAVFTPFVLENEQVNVSLVEQKPGFARAQLNGILQPSPFRIAPGCRYFSHCGGCHYQHSSYEHQLQIKASILRENLRRIAKLELNSELQIHASPPWNYRNRTRLQVRMQPQFALEYNRFGSHELQSIEECPISSLLINRAIGALWQLGRSGTIKVNLRGIEFFASADDTALLLEVYIHGDSPKSTIKDFADTLLSGVPGTVGVVIFGRTEQKSAVLAAAGADSLVYTTARASYRVSAGAFFQVNRFLTDELVYIVSTGVSGNTALDLYAGVGLFSTVLSRAFERVIAVESSSQSGADLAYNSPGNVEPKRTSVEQYLRQAGQRPDFIVLDPPRGGLGTNLARAIADLRAPRLTYVSCDPATLARDLVPLLAAGYGVEQAHLVDLFPQTFHLETVVQLVRRNR